MLDLYDELKGIIRNLNEAKVEYALCGGLALAVYGISRATVDIDLLVLKESLDAIKTLVKKAGYNFDAGIMTFRKGAIKIQRITKIDPASGDTLALDLLLVTPDLKTIWETRREMRWENQKLWVVSIEGLMAMKSLRGKGQDLDDIQILKETANEG
jgi:predicted nucleotidyltransferase